MFLGGKLRTQEGYDKTIKSTGAIFKNTAERILQSCRRLELMIKVNHRTKEIELHTQNNTPETRPFALENIPQEALDYDVGIYQKGQEVSKNKKIQTIYEDALWNGFIEVVEQG